jgi:TatD DNase family protein
MQLIDTHSHKYLREFENNWDEAIQRAKDNFVSNICIPNVDEETIPHVLQLADQYPGYCLPMMGIHPTHVEENYQSAIDKIEKLLNEHSFVAVGEIGIDLYWDKSKLDLQIDAFAQQLALAEKHNLPVNIHVRDAFDETFKVLEDFGKGRFSGILHCFSGDKEQAEHAIDLGLKLGIGGIVTFKKAHLADVVTDIDLEHLVLETDAPFLAPAPHRGKTNESSYLIHIAKKIASLKGITVQEVAKQTTLNTQSIFKIEQVATKL